MKGPPPKPTLLKLAAGTDRPDRANPDEPTPEPMIPDCPEWLRENAKEFWNNLAPMLFRVGIMTEAEQDALGGLCTALCDLRDVQSKIQQFGHVVKNPAGTPIINPYVTIQYKALDTIKAYLAEFGMTPAARSRIVRAAKNANPGTTRKDETRKKIFGNRPG